MHGIESSPGRVGASADADAADRLRDLLRYAVLAPSRHNAQPWRFAIEGPELAIHADPRRALHAADPKGRELAIACGAAAYDVELAAACHGLATSLEVVAGGRRDALLARLTLEERRAPAPGDARLLAAMPARRTDRLALDARDPPPGLLATLVADAAALDAGLVVVEATVRPAVAALVEEASHAQWSSPRFRAELARWTRAGGAGGEGDGLSAPAYGLSGAAALVRRALLPIGAGDLVGGEARRDGVQALRARALLALCTRGDAPEDWVRAGRALQRVLLRAAVAGLSASFFSAPVQVAAVRPRLRAALGARGFPQVLFRLGFGRPPPPTPRRPVGAVLEALRAGPPAHALARRSPLPWDPAEASGP